MGSTAPATPVAVIPGKAVDVVVPLKQDEQVREAEEMRETLAEAASEAKTDKEKAAVMAGLSDTPRLTESGIAADVLEKLLPDEGVVELPRVRKVAGGPVYRFVKRTFDVVSCGAALLVLAIPMAIIAAKIKSESSGPVIYAQRRVGKDGKVFELYKFRSMYTDAEARGARWAAEDDPRVTPFGRTMRRTRLDELPQFWNVVKGDIPSRILKTRRGFSLKKPGAFALPARLARTRIAASLQVRVVISAITGVPQNLFEYFIAGYGEMREVFAKRDSRIDFPLRDRSMPIPCNGLPI